MAMRKYLIGLIAGLAGAIALSSVASAAVTGVSIESSVTPSKGDKKIRSGVSTFFASNDTHSGVLPCPLGTADSPTCLAFPPSVQSVITFPTSLKFDPGNLPDCQLSRIVGQSSAGARRPAPGRSSEVDRTPSSSPMAGPSTARSRRSTGPRRAVSRRCTCTSSSRASQPSRPQRHHSGQRADGADPPGPGLGDRAVRHDDQQGRQQEDEEQEHRQGEEDVLPLRELLEAQYTVREDVTYQDGTTLTTSTPGRCKQTNSKKK